MDSFWASPGMGDSDPNWASPRSGDFVPHLDLIAVEPFWASPGTGDSDPNWAHPDLVTLSSLVDHYDLDTLFHT